MERPVGDGRILVRDVAVQRLDGKEQRVLKSRGGQFVNGWGIVEQGGRRTQEMARAGSNTKSRSGLKILPKMKGWADHKSDLACVRTVRRGEGAVAWSLSTDRSCWLLPLATGDGRGRMFCESVKVAGANKY